MQCVMLEVKTPRHLKSVTDWPVLNVAGKASWQSDLTSREQLLSVSVSTEEMQNLLELWQTEAHSWPFVKMLSLVCVCICEGVLACGHKPACSPWDHYQRCSLLMFLPPKAKSELCQIENTKKRYQKKVLQTFVNGLHKPVSISCTWTFHIFTVTRREGTAGHLWLQ